MSSDLAWLSRITTRLRVVFAALGAVASAFFVNTLVAEYNLVKLDYFAWFAFAAILLALVLDTREYARSYGYASILTLDVVALSMALVSRFTSSGWSMYLTGLTAPIIGWSIADWASALLSGGGPRRGHTSSGSGPMCSSTGGNG